jgi:hypothetical protein
MEEEKRRRNNEYYNCGKSGHYSAHCLTKKPYYDRRTYWAAEATVGEASVEDVSEKRIPGSKEPSGTPGEESHHPKTTGPHLHYIQHGPIPKR